MARPLVGRIALLLCLLALPLLATAWSPYTALRPYNLVALYPLADDLQDVAPSGARRAGVARRLADSSSYDGGILLQQQTSIDLDLDIRSHVFLQLTLGAWVQFDGAAAQTGYAHPFAACILLSRW